MKKALLYFLKDFKFARQRLGGTWYYVVHVDSITGMAGSINYWTQIKPNSEEVILDTEDYVGVVKSINPTGRV